MASAERERTWGFGDGAPAEYRGRAPGQDQGAKPPEASDNLCFN
jgi:hypothetical protein